MSQKRYRVQGLITRGYRNYYVEADSKEEAFRLVEADEVDYDEEGIEEIHFSLDDVEEE